MNRRKFLSFLGIGVATAKLSALNKLLPETDAEYYHRKRIEAGPGGWVSYRVRYTVTLAPIRSSRLRFAPA